MFDKRYTSLYRGARIGEDSSVLLGGKSVADCDNLIANYNTWINQLGDQYQAAMSAWKAKAPDASKAWGLDYNKLTTRWGLAKDAVDKVRSKLTLDRFTAANDEYNGLILAIRQGGEGAPVQTSDFLDLRDRLNAFTSGVQTLGPVVLKAAVQPTSDPSSVIYQGLGSIDPVGTLATGKVPGLGVPIPWTQIATIAGVVVVGLVAIEVVPMLFMGSMMARQARR